MLLNSPNATKIVSASKKENRHSASAKETDIFRADHSLNLRRTLAPFPNPLAQYAASLPVNDLDRLVRIQPGFNHPPHARERLVGTQPMQIDRRVRLKFVPHLSFPYSDFCELLDAPRVPTIRGAPSSSNTTGRQKTSRAQPGSRLRFA